MPSISYSKENIKTHGFKNKIIQGMKIHTIRRYRKRPFQIGDILFHYENWRSPKVEMFYENKCLYLADFIFEFIGDKGRIKVNDKIIFGWDWYGIAINDGFDDFQQFKDYFIKSGLPFHGQIIGWKEGINYGN